MNGQKGGKVGVRERDKRRERQGSHRQKGKGVSERGMEIKILEFLPHDASAEHGNATVSRPSVCLSVCDV